MFKKIKTRNRIVSLTEEDWYETSTGARFPIKQKPLVFFDMYSEITEKSSELVKWEQKRAAGDDYDAEEYAAFITDFFERFIEIIILITKFNGYETDESYVKSNMGYEDLNWYLRSVYMGKPVYSFEDLKTEEKKTL